MACKNKTKRARPSAHLKSVRTRNGKKVVVVNRDVTKKTKRNLRAISTKGRMSKIRIDPEAKKLGFLDSTKGSPKGLDVLPHLDTKEEMKSYTKRLLETIDESAENDLKSAFHRVAKPYTDKDFRVRKFIEEVEGSIEAPVSKKKPFSEFVKTLSSDDLVNIETVDNTVVYDPEVRGFVERKRLKQ